MLEFGPFWSILLQSLATLEFRMASSPALLALGSAAAFGMHAVWSNLDANGRALLTNERYLQLIRGLADDQVDLFSPLDATRRMFLRAVVLWTMVAIDSVIAMAVVPWTFTEAGAIPTYHFYVQAPLLLIALLWSASVWLRRLSMDRDIHRILSKATNFDRMSKGQNPRRAVG